jgi:hypothetical protein
LVIAIQDAPLIQLGPLEFGERQLMGYDGIEDDGENLYSWVMNNFWETNGRVSVGGFYEFRYSIEWSDEFKDQSNAIKRCHSINEGLIGFRSAK